MIWRVLPDTDVAADIARQLDAVLAEKKDVLVLVSGGSAISHEARLFALLKNTDNLLAILPIDERFGPAGHVDSNVAQLRAQLPAGNTLPLVDILTEDGSSKQSAERFAHTANDLFDRASMVIAIMGMGADGHTAGVLPGSPAVESDESVVGYEWTDYRRLTVGLSLLRRIDQAYLIAYGGNKQEALHRLYENSEPLDALPAKLLYDISDVTIYNEYINEG